MSKIAMANDIHEMLTRYIANLPAHIIEADLRISPREIPEMVITFHPTLNIAPGAEELPKETKKFYIVTEEEYAELEAARDLTLRDELIHRLRWSRSYLLQMAHDPALAVKTVAEGIAETLYKFGIEPMPIPAPAPKPPERAIFQCGACGTMHDYLFSKCAGCKREYPQHKSGPGNA